MKHKVDYYRHIFVIFIVFCFLYNEFEHVPTPFYYSRDLLFSRVIVIFKNDSRNLLLQLEFRVGSALRHVYRERNPDANRSPAFLGTFVTLSILAYTRVELASYKSL